ncbi:MAG TPA: HoxN/HupN/NixA family nickel/cobalt transporter [bacterium]|nr:HoxN/HupN/NixA family nickel/cobalt transporter [bacterium]
MGIAWWDDGPQRVGAKAGALYLLLVGANLAAWGFAFAAFGHRPALLGTAFLAYLFGLRHAVDADHIAAIDNVVRRLLQSGRRPITAGFFFSLGHSTVVVLASALLAGAVGLSRDRWEAFHSLGATVGTAVSAFFLVGIGLANLLVLRGLWRVFRRMGRGETVREEEWEGLLSGRGFLARLLGPFLRGVTHSGQMYPVGFLFGLGFDTATEVGLLGLAAAQAAQGLSFGDTLVFPALFTAGMDLVDATDSVLMTRAYQWAFVRPLRKLWYNLTLTALSVAVALVVGGLEALGLLAGQGGSQGGGWDLVRSLNSDLADFGFLVAGVFLAGWALSVFVYRLQGYERAGPGPDAGVVLK